MEANCHLNKFSIKDKSKTVQVPPNDLAQLMYYLHCVYDVLKISDLIPYINYQNYNNLSNREKNDVIYYANLFSPTKMTAIKAFIQEDNVNFSNKFFEITDETYGIHANEDFVIGGKVAKISKVMVYCSNWVMKNYYFPLKRLTSPPPLPAPLFSPPPYIYYSNRNPNYPIDDTCLCSCEIF